MSSKRNSKPIDGVSFAEFARIIDRSKGYISQMKAADRLVLTADGKRVLIDESITKLNATKDIGKWPLAVYHQQARDKKRADEQAPVEEELKPDPAAEFLRTLLSDAVAPMCAELMLDSGMSLQQAAYSYHAVCRAIGQTRENAGYKNELWRLRSPVETCTPADWRAEIEVEIEEIVSPEKLREQEGA